MGNTVSQISPDGSLRWPWGTQGSCSEQEDLESLRGISDSPLPPVSPALGGCRLGAIPAGNASFSWKWWSFNSSQSPKRPFSYVLCVVSFVDKEKQHNKLCTFFVTQGQLFNLERKHDLVAKIRFCNQASRRLNSMSVSSSVALVVLSTSRVAVGTNEII